ncbi:hypothetical protein AB0M20_11875 [Actinoplanes sp. NPDC051633]|uniref:hypothetical protein n=1 Tax=Actinoplanes sp. NPDC051633 TaxID=3155670 RepID=UPI0034467B9E
MAVFWTLLGVVLGIAGKYVVDLKLAKANKLREEKLKWSVEFLAAASQLAQAVSSEHNWQLELRDMSSSEVDHPSTESQSYRLKRSREVQAKVQSAWSDAYRARSAVRLLMPDATEGATTYLELCGKAIDPSEENASGAESRQEIEDTLRKQISV